ncbi:MAG: hypothetical protein RMI85_00795 [Candidatus Korarchaeum sp.]|nr:hypothetical protein [Candidatus Korarchaeum sp.]
MGKLRIEVRDAVLDLEKEIGFDCKVVMRLCCSYLFNLANHLSL